jgi:hypothetical protein
VRTVNLGLENPKEKAQLAGTPLGKGSDGGSMRHRFVTPLIVAVVTLFAAPAAQALPIQFSIDNCASGDCVSYVASGQGAILASLDVINGNDLLITLTNALNEDADNDDPYLTSLGFEYGSLLSGLTFDSFRVLSGVVATPTFAINTSIRSFFIDFGFAFSDDLSTSGRDRRFQAMDPDEVVQIIVGTSGAVDLNQFVLGVAKVAGAGTNGRSSAIVLTGTPTTPTSIPEPQSLLAVLVGFGAFTAHRRQRRRAS